MNIVKTTQELNEDPDASGDNSGLYYDYSGNSKDDNPYDEPKIGSFTKNFNVMRTYLAMLGNMNK